jgi:4-hydroxyphenylacetate decarboxylase small subunit
MNYCKDCRLYLPVDVFRGLCKLEKKEILPDDESCSRFDAVPKCKYCRNYKPDKDYLGTCMGTTIAYPDLIAAKCADFQWISQN